MRPRTDGWDTAVKASHQMVVEADIWYGGEVYLDGLRVVDGQVTSDRNAAILGRCSLTLAEPELLPLTAGDPLSPYGYEVAVRRGIVYGDGTRELMDLGLFPIQKSATDGVSLLRSVSTMDRAQRVSDAKFEDVRQVAAGTNYGDAIHDLIDEALPGLTYAFASTTFTTPLLTFPAFSDRWEAVRLMARSIGMELFFDGIGRPVLRNEPDVRTAVPVAEVAETVGTVRGVLLSINVDQSREDIFNRVVAVGQNGSNTAQYRGVATDDDPWSPTYYFGPFGRKPRQFTSAFIGSQDQADQAAAAVLVSQLGFAASVVLDAVPNVALEAGDPILVKRGVLGIDQVHLADKMVTGLSPDGVQRLESRTQQVAA